MSGLIQLMIQTFLLPGRPVRMPFSFNPVTPIINRSLQANLRRRHWNLAQPRCSSSSQNPRQLLMPYWWIWFTDNVWVCNLKKNGIRCKHLKVTFYVKILISSFFFEKKKKNRKIWQNLAAMQWFVPLEGTHTPSFSMAPTWPPPSSKGQIVAGSCQAQAIRSALPGEPWTSSISITWELARNANL